MIDGSCLCKTLAGVLRVISKAGACGLLLGLACEEKDEAGFLLCLEGLRMISGLGSRV